MFTQGDICVPFSNACLPVVQSFSFEAKGSNFLQTPISSTAECVSAERESPKKHEAKGF